MFSAFEPSLGGGAEDDIASADDGDGRGGYVWVMGSISVFQFS